MNYYIISGEASGDLHGANLIKAIKKLDTSASFRFWGGDLMAAEAGTPIKHYKELAFMGFIEVIMNLPTILKNISFCKKDIRANRPDVVILIDYPGFNLRIAKAVKGMGIKAFYYISPSIWAWKQSRVHLIKKVVDRMFVILPFEKAFYKKFDVDVDYVGHPLLDAIEKRDNSEERKSTLRKEMNLDDQNMVLLLPGSRKQEINAMLPIMLEQSKSFPKFQFVIGAAPGLDLSIFDNFIKTYPKVKIVVNRTYDLLQLAHAALVTSGTATLETALFKVPEVVCYKGSFISYQIAKRLVKVKYISLVNLIMDREVVKELIQEDLNEKLLKAELGKLLEDNAYRAEMQANFEKLIDQLGDGGASMRLAQLMVEDLNKEG
tara:strand:- start:2121 stop:3251 length:1131 start_codon:yes stop_codon:yes gene_type:complete